MINTNNQAKILLCCYTYKDKDLSQELLLHLSSLRRAGFIQTFHEREINVGETRKEAVDRRIYEANIILLLISADFLASPYCQGRELKIILDRHREGQVYAIPVLLYPLAWKQSPLGKLKALPLGEKAVTDWPVRDEAFVNIAKGVRDTIKLYRIATAVRQKISQLSLEFQQLSGEMSKIARETQQISREIEQIKPALASGSEAGDKVETPLALVYNFAQEGWFKEYQQALNLLQNAVALSIHQCKQIEDFSAF